ncbi:MAG TPA: DUF1365 domain-containing protein [Dehalococcoidia bacterium]|jgi:hypothetical protein
MKSRILHGSVWHMRTQPRYFFRHGAFYIDLTLDEFDEVAQRLRLFSHNRLNLAAIQDSDYMALGDQSILQSLDPNGPPAGRRALSLITMPRLVGYAFNPVSFILTRDAEGRVSNVLAEVHNTFGDRHLYDLAPAQSTDAVYTAVADKAFYVSPFIDIEGRYAFRLREDSGRIRIRIDECRPGEDEPFFRAGMDLTPMTLTDANLLLMLVRYPLVTVKTIGAIHWHGFKLWLRGEAFRHRQRPAGQEDSSTPRQVAAR